MSQIDTLLHGRVFLYPPPDNACPRSPTCVSYPSAKSCVNVCADASLAARSMSRGEAVSLPVSVVNPYAMFDARGQGQGQGQGLG